MAMELVRLDSATLPAIANAIREKTGGSAPLLPSQMPEAIAGIPSALPKLRAPACDDEVLQGKEYINETGKARTGALVVCDTVQESEIWGEPGIGVHLELESDADGSAKQLVLLEQNLTEENIRSGISIFNVAGSVKEIRVETGSITLAAESKTVAVACPSNAKAFVFEADAETVAAIRAQTASTYTVSFVTNFCGKTAGAGNTAMRVWINGNYANTARSAANADGVRFTSGYNFYAGRYQWVAYYWEDVE